MYVCVYVCIVKGGRRVVEKHESELILCMYVCDVCMHVWRQIVEKHESELILCMYVCMYVCVYECM